MSKRMIVGVAIPAVLAALAVSVVLRINRRDDIPCVKVQRTTFVRTVQADGYLKAAAAATIGAPTQLQGPTKIAWLAPDGSVVHKGEVVVRFDPSDMQKNLTDGRTLRARAESRIAGKKAEAMGTNHNLHRDAAIAGNELEYARQFQNTDQLLFSRNQVIESEVDEKLATHRKENADAVVKIRDKLFSADLGLLEIERRQADLITQLAETGLHSLDVTAPNDGVFVLDRDWRGNVTRTGDIEWPGEPIAQIPIVDEMEAEVFVIEADAGGLAVGRTATVTIEAHPEKIYKALVKKVDKLARPRVRLVPVQYFTATLRLELTDKVLMKPGQRVLATIVLDKRTNCIAIPRAALFEKDGKMVVYRRNGMHFDSIAITIGAMALGRVVIEKGLYDGDMIALRDPTRPLMEKTSPIKIGTQPASQIDGKGPKTP